MHQTQQTLSSVIRNVGKHIETVAMVLFQVIYVNACGLEAHRRPRPHAH